MSSQLNATAALPPGEKGPRTHWIGGWVDPRAGLDDVEKRKFLTPPGLEISGPIAAGPDVDAGL
jgi:hypothetical protein